jgi:hypothetical protein
VLSEVLPVTAGFSGFIAVVSIDLGKKEFGNVKFLEKVVILFGDFSVGPPALAFGKTISPSAMPGST